MDNDIVKSHQSTESTNNANENKLSLKNRIFENKIESKWLTSKEVAAYLSISENALRIMVHRDQIPYYKFGRRLRFQLNECLALIQKMGV